MNLLSTKGLVTLSLSQIKYEKQRPTVPIPKVDDKPPRSCEQAASTADWCLESVSEQ